MKEYGAMWNADYEYGYDIENPKEELCKHEWGKTIKVDWYMKATDPVLMRTTLQTIGAIPITIA